MKRREFLSTVGKVFTFAAIAKAVGSSYSWAAGKLKLIDINDGSAAAKTAKGLNYVADFKTAMKAKKIAPPEKPNGKGIKANQQRCKNCMFYGQSTPEVCTLIPGVKVHTEGWCRSWMAKP